MSNPMSVWHYTHTCAVLKTKGDFSVPAERDRYSNYDMRSTVRGLKPGRSKTSRPALTPHQPPVQSAPGFTPEDKAAEA